MTWSTATVCKKVRIGANEVRIIGKFRYAAIQSNALMYVIANTAKIFKCYAKNWRGTTITPTLSS